MLLILDDKEVVVGEVLEGLWPAALAYWHGLSQIQRPQKILLVTSNQQRFDALYDDATAIAVNRSPLASLKVATLRDGAQPFSFFKSHLCSPFERSVFRHAMHASQRPWLAIVEAPALLGKWLPQSIFLASSVDLQVNGVIDTRVLAKQLLQLGYSQVPVVEEPGTFAMRGSIVDIFAPHLPTMWRLDLFGEDIQRILSLDPQEKKILKSIETLSIYPIRDVIYQPCHKEQALRALNQDYFVERYPSRKINQIRQAIQEESYFLEIDRLWPLFYSHVDSVCSNLLQAHDVVILDDALTLSDSLHRCYETNLATYEKIAQKHMPSFDLAGLLEKPQTVFEALWQKATYRNQPLVLVGDHQKVHSLSQPDILKQKDAFQQKIAEGGEGFLQPLVDFLHRYIQQGYGVWLFAIDTSRAQKIHEMLRPYGLQLNLYIEPPWAMLFSQKPAEQSCISGPRQSQKRVGGIIAAKWSASLLDNNRRCLWLALQDIWPQQPQASSSKSSSADQQKKQLKLLMEDFMQLEIGDVLIHQDHGMGTYAGLKRLTLQQIEGDYIELHYVDGDKLYVPIYHVSVLSRYQGPKEHARLDKLGGKRWQLEKQRLKEAVLAFAQQLLSQQALRKNRRIEPMQPPSPLYLSFEATFPYTETPDQKRAIEAILDDLQKPYPMDRLLCGDVGFGKTEVAMRAAFLALQNGFQVAVLVPTTILAEQHRQTFQARMAGFAIQVASLSRLLAKKEQEEIFEQLRRGEIDIVIGTHQLLSRDVVFKNLGLLIIDEEQRFGVKHKEQLKRFGSHLHVLTLSATPIPRTLHMASMGLRDLSLIATPPAHRLAVVTEVMPFDKEMMKEALKQELQRGGQAFVVHHRIQSLNSMMQWLQKLLPEARIAVAHGQLSPKQLEKTMAAFVLRQSDILLCTGIVESGIDMPSVNTMIVNRADTFGLAQLYQLRGRVGRGKQQGYLYLMVPPGNTIGPQAQGRLAALKRLSHLGAGFHISTYDLELRGAGQILGEQQSGHVAAVGYSLYLELLQEAVEQLRSGHGQTIQKSVIEPHIEIAVKAVLPEAYIPATAERLNWYQKLGSASHTEEITALLLQMQHRFGPCPQEVLLLEQIFLLRLQLLSYQATSIYAKQQEGIALLWINFAPSARIAMQALMALCQQMPTRYALLPNGRMRLSVALSEGVTDLDFLHGIRKSMAELWQQIALPHDA